MSAVLGHSLSSPANASEGHTALLLSSTCTLVYTFRISNLAYCRCSLATIVDNLSGKLQNVIGKVFEKVNQHAVRVILLVDSASWNYHLVQSLQCCHYDQCCRLGNTIVNEKRQE